jgi:signal transduction histidine kinase
MSEKPWVSPDDLHPEQTLAKELEGERLAGHLQQMIDFDEENSHILIYQNLNDFSAVNKEELERFLQGLKHVFLCSDVVFRQMLSDNMLSSTVQHDLGNISQQFFGSRDLLNLALKNNDFKVGSAIYKIFIKSYFAFVFIMEDVVLRRLNPGIVPKEYPKRSLHFDKINVALEGLKQKQISYYGSKNIRTENCGEQAGSSVLLTEDEEVLMIPGVVYYALSNIFKNACKEGIHSSSIILKCYREGDNLVYRIEDNGVGMDKDMLNPENPKFVFNAGVSHTGSTGIGLSDMHTRIPSIGGELKVISADSEHRQKGEFFEYSSISGLQNNDGVGMEKLSTIFEIRFPITKKSK